MVGEAELEMFLEEYPPIESNIAQACGGLTEAKSYLTESISEAQVINYYSKYIIYFTNLIQIISSWARVLIVICYLLNCVMLVDIMTKQWNIVQKPS